jgi:hypothetical protein
LHFVVVPGKLSSMHDFENLRRWRSLSDEELENSYSWETVALLRRCVVALGEISHRQQHITRENFVAMARTASKLLRDGSNALSDTIRSADEFLRQGDVEAALQAY